MFEYTTNLTVDHEIFNRTCHTIQKNCKDAKIEDYLVDVDGSEIMLFSTPKGKIKVFNDCDIDAVYVESEIPLQLGSLEIDLKTHKRKSENPF